MIQACQPMGLSWTCADCGQRAVCTWLCGSEVQTCVGRLLLQAAAASFCMCWERCVISLAVSDSTCSICILSIPNVWYTHRHTLVKPAHMPGHASCLTSCMLGLSLPVAGLAHERCMYAAGKVITVGYGSVALCPRFMYAAWPVLAVHGIGPLLRTVQSAEGVHLWTSCGLCVDLHCN